MAFCQTAWRLASLSIWRSASIRWTFRLRAVRKISHNPHNPHTTRGIHGSAATAPTTPPTAKKIKTMMTIQFHTANGIGIKIMVLRSNPWLRTGRVSNPLGGRRCPGPHQFREPHAGIMENLVLMLDTHAVARSLTAADLHARSRRTALACLV